MKDVVIIDATLREFGQNVLAQSVPAFSVAKRVKALEMLVDAGVTSIEYASFVHPRVAPAMEEHALKTIHAREPRAEYISLVPNQKGFAHFLNWGFSDHTLGLFFSVVESHNQLNKRCSIAEDLIQSTVITTQAHSLHIPVDVSLSTVFKGHYYKGVLDPADNQLTADLVRQLFNQGVRMVSLADTQGLCDPQETFTILDDILRRNNLYAFLDRINYHPHHTDARTAVDNVWAAYSAGVRTFTSSLGGTGGCPTGAPGNVATEDLVSLFDGKGIATGIDSAKINAAVTYVEQELYAKCSIRSGP